MKGKCNACTNNTECSGGLCINGACVKSTQVAARGTFCGNGKIDAGELCDNGALNSIAPNAACRPDCTPGRCGDSIVDTPLELCDDGNRNDGDGCSATCVSEHASTTIDALPASMFEIPFFGTPGDLRPNPNPNPILIQHPPVGSTGPEAIIIIAAGASAGVAFMRRKRL